MKQIVAVTLIVLSLVLVGCSQGVTDNQIKEELEKLPPEEVAKLAEETEGDANGAIAGQASKQNRRIKVGTLDVSKTQLAKVIDNLEIKKCIDQDNTKPAVNGNDIYTKSVAFMTDGTGTKKEDHCNAKGKLTEYYCDDDSISQKEVECESGCSEGVCLKEGKYCPSGFVYNELIEDELYIKEKAVDVQYNEQNTLVSYLNVTNWYACMVTEDSNMELDQYCLKEGSLSYRKVVYNDSTPFSGGPSGLKMLCIETEPISESVPPSEEYCVGGYDFKPIVNPPDNVPCMLPSKGAKKGDKEVWFYGCMEKPFPEELKEKACPEGTKPTFWSMFSYTCYKETHFNFSGCLPGYEIGYDYSQGQPDSNGVGKSGQVKCKLISKNVFDYPEEEQCGNSGAKVTGGGGEGYCCAYVEE